MKTIKIFSLLFSVSQLLLILKLIEYVRGDPIPINFHNITEKSSQPNYESETRENRGFSLTARGKNRKYKPWFETDNLTTEHPYLSEDESEEITITPNNFTELERMDKINLQNATFGEDPLTAKLCPNCDNTTTPVVTSAAFPIIQVFISFVIGVVWFFVFLYIWYYAVAPPKAGYGKSSDWISSSTAFFEEGWLSSALNYFTGGQRSLDSFNDLTSFVSNSLSNLAKIYADA